MAKRYGRNQRRKHREQIAALESTLKSIDAIHRLKTLDLVRELDVAHSLIVAWDNDVRAMLGDYSAFLIETGRIKNGEIFDVPLFARLKAYTPLSSQDISKETVRDRMTTLRNLISLEYVEMDLRFFVRFEQVDRYGKTYLHIGYSLPEFELQRMYGRDYSHLAQQIAHSFRSYIENRSTNPDSNYKEFRP